LAALIFLGLGLVLFHYHVVSLIAFLAFGVGMMQGYLLVGALPTFAAITFIAFLVTRFKELKLFQRFALVLLALACHHFVGLAAIALWLLLEVNNRLNGGTRQAIMFFTVLLALFSTLPQVKVSVLHYIIFSSRTVCLLVVLSCVCLGLIAKEVDLG